MSFLALALALFMLGYVARVGDRLPARAASPSALAVPAATGPQTPTALMTAAGPEPRSPQPPHRPPPAPGPATTAPGARYLAPRCAALCKVAMGITMGYMLILML